MNIYITGPIGSKRRELAHKISDLKNLKFLDFDSEIEKIDGRSVSRICMLMGEHEYRNKEYELLVDLKNKDNYVCACSDGILFDPMCAELMNKGKIMIADFNLSSDALWEQVCNDASTFIPYAFMLDQNKENRKNKFVELYNLRKPIYNKYIENMEEFND